MSCFQFSDKVDWMEMYLKTNYNQIFYKIRNWQMLFVKWKQWLFNHFIFSSKILNSIVKTIICPLIKRISIRLFVLFYLALLFNPFEIVSLSLEAV